jgi:hypothetical protein
LARAPRCAHRSIRRGRCCDGSRFGPRPSCSID